jgi:hypothetical protein
LEIRGRHGAAICDNAEGTSSATVK